MGAIIPGGVAGPIGRCERCTIFFSGVVAAVTTTFTIIGTVAWLANHSPKIGDFVARVQRGYIAFLGKETRSEADCKAAWDYLQSQIAEFRHLNITNRQESRVGIQKIANKILGVHSVEGMLKKISDKTKQVWDACTPGVRTDMGMRLSPLNINLGNVLDSAPELYSWLVEVGSSNESRLKCLEEKDKITTNLEKTHNTLDDCRTQSTSELKELNLRVGACQELEKIKTQNEELLIERTDLHLRIGQLSNEVRHLNRELGELNHKNQKGSSWWSW